MDLATLYIYVLVCVYVCVCDSETIIKKKEAMNYHSRSWKEERKWRKWYNYILVNLIKLKFKNKYMYTQTYVYVCMNVCMYVCVYVCIMYVWIPASPHAFSIIRSLRPNGKKWQILYNIAV